MKTKKRKLFGFRSGVPWKSGVALSYYVLCVLFLFIGMATPPLIPAGPKDTLIVKLSSLVLLVWMLSPAIFLSETPLREKLPFFRDHRGMRSLVGLMIVSVLFLYLFMITEALHTLEYKEAFGAYISDTFELFVEAGTPG